VVRMGIPPIDLAERLALLLALTLFLGLAFEEIYKRDEPAIPGGIRTFPLVGLAGAMLYLGRAATRPRLYRWTPRDRGLALCVPEARAAGGSGGGQDADRPYREPPCLRPRPNRLGPAGLGRRHYYRRDITPFLLSLAQGGAPGMSPVGLAAAVLIAASTNNLAKAGYAIGFGGRTAAVRPSVMLAVLGLLGFAAAAVYLV
jgi:hypothetical protein